MKKNEVIGIVAHDLKNPISGILLTAEAIQKYYTQLSGQEVEKQMLRIMSVAERMKAIVMNLLDIQRIESGQMQLNIVPVSVVKIIEVGLSLFTFPTEYHRVFHRVSP